MNPPIQIARAPNSTPGARLRPGWQLSDDALAAVKLRVETKEAEERERRWAVDTISLAVRAMPISARQRRVTTAKRRLDAALKAGAGMGKAPTGPSSDAGSSQKSYYSACTSVSSASGASGGHRLNSLPY